ncbi:MAG TPA: FlgD immunoglobulin-like domain containing protein, partial [Candidatus Krumholzibacteria bacterium]|nr:FlgD immunoglobulin-like domain containing protein [Candidatus Krumholzibacteria bacterium]
MKAHAVLVLVVSFVLHPCVGHAAWQPNGNGVAVLAGTQGSPQIIPDGTGGTIITWSDDRNGNPNIYAQRLNGLGVAQWTLNGVVVCSDPAGQFYAQLVSDGSGGAIVVWQDNRNGKQDVYAQRVDGAGVVQWTANGVVLCTAAGNRYLLFGNPSVVSDGSGGAIVVFQDSRNGSGGDIYAQRINGSGMVQWTAAGVGLCVAAGRQWEASIASDAAGGAIVAWDDERSGSTIYAQRVNGSGVPQWTANGVACSNGVLQGRPTIITDPSGGAFVAWQDQRNGDPDVYAQRLDGSGTAYWSSGAPVGAGPGNQLFAALVSDGAGGVIVVWRDGRNGVDTDIYAQRLNANSLEMWTSNGMPLCTAPGDQATGGIASDGAGGVIATWADARSGTSDIYVQRVKSNGVVQLSPDGAALCTAADVQDAPFIAAIKNGDAVVTWEDARSDADDVYALAVPNTGIGNNVRYKPIPYLIPEQPYGVGLRFDHVITAGFTYLDITPAGPALPPSFVLGDGRYYNLSTTAGTEGNIDVCIKFNPAALQHPAAALRVFQYSLSPTGAPRWLDVTTQPAAGDSICGTATTLSTFVIGYPSVTGVGDTPAPASFALNANVPNPFNPITTIRYDVPAPGADVKISVYDVAGRLVRELVKEHRGAGAWSVQWNGDNDRGQAASSGVYFYR